ncbi:MAG: hypothetical protein M1821_007398 [Bathelium mastoideum]|nr:MAG: hypothetical protein M1821_007398 [Bathelium mastoideum]
MEGQVADRTAGNASRKGSAKDLIGLITQSRDRWLQTGKPAEIDTGIYYAKQAVDALPSGDPDRVEYLKFLWLGFYTRFRLFNRFEDLDLAITCEGEALVLVQDCPSTIKHFEEVGVGFYLRYQIKGTLSDLDQAILCGETAVAASSREQSTRYHKQLASLAVRLVERHRLGDVLEDLNQSIIYMEEAIDIAPENDVILPGTLNNMITGLNKRYQRNYQEDDLNRAASLVPQLLNVMTAGDPQRPDYLANLGTLFHNLFLMKGNIESLHQAITYGHEALDLTQTDNRHYARHVARLGCHYRALYRRSGQLSDLEKALEYMNMATGAAEHDIDSASELANQAMVLHDIYRVNGVDTYLDQAISHGVKGLRAVIEPRQRSSCIRFLSIVYQDRFLRDGLESDLRTAEEYAQQALRELSKDNRTNAESFSTLGSISRYRFQIKGDVSDIDDAIAYSEQGLANSNSHDEAYLDYLVNYAISLISRFGRTGHKADLEQAIRNYKTAVDSTPRGDPKGAEYLCCLSNALALRFQRDGRIEDLDEAIKNGQHGVQTLPKSHVARATNMNALAQIYRQRFEREKKGSDLQLAIQNHREALNSVSKKHAEYVTLLKGMGLVWKLNYEHTGDETSLNDAIYCAGRAIDASSQDDPERAQLFNNLGYLLIRRRCDSSIIENRKLRRPFQAVPQALICSDGFSLDCLRESSQVFSQALNCSTGFPLDRVVGGYMTASILATIEDYAGADKALRQTLELVPRVTSPTNSRDDLQYVLPKLSGLGILAASVFSMSHRSPVEAIYAIEDCRGIIANFTMNARSNTDLLKEKHPDLWSHHTQLQNEIGNLQLANQSLRFGSHVRQSHSVTHRKLQQLHKDLDDTRNEIRGRPGFERFLLSPSEIDMRKLSSNGYIVCLNSSSIGSEAFLVTPERIWIVPLPKLLVEDTAVLSSRLAREGNFSRRDAFVVEDVEDDEDDEADENEEYLLPLSLSEQLQMLWTAAVRPILQELGLLCDFDQIKDVKSLPRVWWVGRGKMGFAPVHAAGDSTPGSTENTLSHVLSSYAPSFKSLQFIQEKSHRFQRDIKHKMMLVSMPTTPGHKDLNVKDEVSAISKSVEPWAALTPLEYPSKQDVLSTLEKCTIAHFACHGVADRVDPAKSALLVGQENVVQMRRTAEKLRVEDLDGVSSNCAQIIYLSACSTAENKIEGLVDEDIHLASSFQLLGFPHVICTLWGADDDASVQVARSFYEVLGSCNQASDRVIAEALHAAILRYRNAGDNWKDFIKWAPFIHLGC